MNIRAYGRNPAVACAWLRCFQALFSFPLEGLVSMVTWIETVPVLTSTDWRDN